MYKLFHQWCIYFRCLWFCVCVFVSVCVIESTTLCITYYILCLHSKERKQQSSEEAVHRPSVCLSLRWYKRVMCMLLFCAQFFEAFIFAIHRYPNNMVYNTDFVYGLRDDGQRSQLFRINMRFLNILTIFVIMKHCQTILSLMG